MYTLEVFCFQGRLGWGAGGLLGIGLRKWYPIKTDRNLKYICLGRSWYRLYEVQRVLSLEILGGVEFTH